MEISPVPAAQHNPVLSAHRVLPKFSVLQHPSRFSREGYKTCSELTLQIEIKRSAGCSSSPRQELDGVLVPTTRLLFEATGFHQWYLCGAALLSSVCNRSPLFPCWHFCLSVMPEPSFLPGHPPAYHNLVKVGVCPFLFQSQFISPEGFLLRVRSVKGWQQTNDNKILSCLFRLSCFRCFPSTAWYQKSLFPSPTFVQSVSNAWDGNNLVAHPSLLWDQL